LYGAIAARTTAKRRYHRAKGALDYLAKPSNTLKALQMVEPAETDDRLAAATKEHDVSKKAYDAARAASRHVGNTKRRLLAARKKQAVISHFVAAQEEAALILREETMRLQAAAAAEGGTYVDDGELAEMITPDYRGAHVIGMRLLRHEDWQLSHLLKVTDEAYAWYRKARDDTLQARGAIRVLNEMITRVKAPGEIDDAETDVLRLSAAVLGGAGRARGVLATCRVVVPVYATAEHLLVKMVEENWPGMSGEVATRLQVIFDGKAVAGAEVLVEAGIISSDKLQILLPPNTALPDGDEMESSTGFTTGTADGLHQSISTMQQQLHDLTTAIAEDQWAATYERHVRRELQATEGAMRQVESLHRIISAFDPDDPEADLPAVKERKKKMAEEIAAVDGFAHDDWSWAPGLAEAAAAAQEAAKARKRHAIIQPPPSEEPEDWRAVEQRLAETDEQASELLESTLDNEEHILWQADASTVAACGSGTEQEVSLRVVKARRQQGKHMQMLNKARGEYEALWEGAAAPGECCYSADVAKEQADNAWTHWQEVRETLMEEEESARDRARLAIIADNGMDALGPPPPPSSAGPPMIADVPPRSPGRGGDQWGQPWDVNRPRSPVDQQVGLGRIVALYCHSSTS
jgi:hypothetical protein